MKTKPDLGAHMREMRENALLILEMAGTDLELGGHSDAYERSYLLDGHYGDADSFSESLIKSNGRPDGAGPYVKPAGTRTPHAGTVYVVAGTSGQTGSLQPKPRPGDAGDAESFEVRRGKVGGYVDYLKEADCTFVNRVMDEDVCPFYSEAKAAN